jgi:hypothetical protein
VGASSSIANDVRAVFATSGSVDVQASRKAALAASYIEESSSRTPKVIPPLGARVSWPEATTCWYALAAASGCPTRSRKAEVEASKRAVLGMAARDSPLIGTDCPSVVTDRFEHEAKRDGSRRRVLGVPGVDGEAVGGGRLLHPVVVLQQVTKCHCGPRRLFRIA